jgi:hypothetical protein
VLPAPAALRTEETPVKDTVQKLELKMQAMKRKLEEARARESRLERKADTKRKVLLGAMLKAWMESDEAMKATVHARLDKYLTRNSDRRYFGLNMLKTDKPDGAKRS